MWVFYNPNPKGARVGDCAIRAVSKALNLTWEEAYFLIMAKAFSMYDMPSSNAVWGEVLREHGFKRRVIPTACPDCYSVKDFCRDNPQGVYVLGASGHVVTAENGIYFDTWDSGDEIVIYFWFKEA